jgi:hypothetical protein
MVNQLRNHWFLRRSETAIVVIVCVLSLILARLTYFRRLNEGASHDPLLSVTPSSVALGAITQGERRSFHFTIKNQSDSAITQIVVTSSCGCTVLEQSPSNLAPGESARLRGEYDSTGRRGPFKSDLLISFRANGHEQHHRFFHLTGDVKYFVQVRPKELHFSATGSRTNGASKLVTLISSKERPFDLLAVASSHPVLKAEILDPQQLLPANSSSFSRTIKVSFDASAWNSSSERSSPYLSVRTSVQSEPVLKIPVKVEEL